MESKNKKEEGENQDDLMNLLPTSEEERRLWLFR